MVANVTDDELVRKVGGRGTAGPGTTAGRHLERRIAN
jgi:hypothetical protein